MEKEKELKALAIPSLYSLLMKQCGRRKGYLTSDRIHWLMKAGQKEIEMEIKKEAVRVKARQ